MADKLKDFVSGQGLRAGFQEGAQAPGKTFHAPERVIEREAGCWNCLHFEAGELAARRYQECTARDRGIMIHEKGMIPLQVDRILAQRAVLMAPPKSGLCLKGDAADFVAPTYLCTRYQSRIRPDKIGETPQAIRHRLDGDTDKE